MKNTSSEYCNGDVGGQSPQSSNVGATDMLLYIALKYCHNQLPETLSIIWSQWMKMEQEHNLMKRLKALVRENLPKRQDKN